MAFIIDFNYISHSLTNFIVLIKLQLTITLAFCFLCLPLNSQYDFDVGSIPDSLLTKANSVIRHSLVTIDMHEDKLIYKYDYAITALNKKHEEKLLFAEHFHKKESKVKDVKISIYDSEGELTRKIKKKEIKEYGLQNIEFADDTRSMVYMHQSPTYPVTIHVTYTHEVESPYFVKTWYPVTDFRQALENAQITITDHIGDSFNFQAFDIPQPQQGGKSVQYVLRHKKPFFKEKFMPDRMSCLPRLEIALKRLKYFDHVGRINNWNEYGAWIFREMFLPKQDVDLEILKTETSHLLQPSDSDMAIAQKLFEYIQETTRYILILLKDGGLSPLPVSTVHSKKYGDCKALSFYYNSLCQAHGIDAKLVLVNAGDNKQSAREDFYSTIQFNHVISKLEIDDNTYWVDCTSKDNPFNYLGTFTDDRSVLMLENERGTIIKTPEYKNIKTTHSELTINESGDLQGAIEYHTEGIGISEKLYRMPKMNEQEKSLYQKEKLKKYSDPTIHSYSYEFDTTNLNFRERFEIVSEDAAEKFGDHFKIMLNRNELNVPKFKKDKNRVWPIQFLRNEEYVAKTKIKHDLTMVPVLEEDVHIDSEYGHYSFKTTSSAGEISFERQLKIKKGAYPPDQYNQIKSFFDKIKKVEKRSILISSKS